MGGRRGARSALALGALVLAACGAGEPAGPKLVRLIDALDTAEIHSPLLAVEAAASAPDAAASRVLWSGAFARKPERFHISVQPGTFYRVRRSASGCGRLDLTEQAKAGQDLRRHRVEGGSLTFPTTPTTHLLVVSLRPDAAGGCDDAAVSLERIELSREQELALLKAEAPAEGADPARGIAKHGQFLPLPSVENARPPFDQNFDFRDALFAPAPTDLGFDLDVPRQARLRFSYALSSRSRPGDAASFRVSVRIPTGAEEELFADELSIDRAGRSWHWHDAEVDLSPYAGRRIRLTLSTRAPAESRGYALWGQPIVDAPRAPDDPPNVILIAVDTLRADRLSSYGYAEPTTPRLDAFAADGVRFAHAISSSHWTRPAFASLFTGLTPRRHGVTRRFAPLAPQQHTLAEYFRSGGWVTHAVLYKPFLYDDGHHQGFDSFFNVPQTAKFAEQNLRKALIWLQRNGERRFFLFVHFDDPHQPLTQPAEFTSQADRAELAALGLSMPISVRDGGAHFRDPHSGRRTNCEPCVAERARFRRLARHLYDAEIRFVDDRIGALLDYLKERGLYDDALIAFVSDHGESLWDHDGVYAHRNANLYDELVHVPLIVKPPARAGLPRGAVVTRQVRAFDLMPTLLELAGLSVDPGLDARSLVPLLERGDAAEPEDRVAFSESRNAVAVRRGDFKYLSERDPPRERLFALRDDPGEQRDVAGEHPEVVEAMRRLVAAYRSAPGPAEVAEPTQLDARKLEALRELGYIE